MSKDLTVPNLNAIAGHLDLFPVAYGMGAHDTHLCKRTAAALRALTQVYAVLEEVQRLDELQKQQSAELSDLARRARAGEKVQRPQQPTVVDYGDVWTQIKALKPAIRQALLPPKVKP